jgi:hypothetical protein
VPGTGGAVANATSGGRVTQPELASDASTKSTPKADFIICVIGEALGETEPFRTDLRFCDVKTPLDRFASVAVSCAGVFNTQGVKSLVPLTSIANYTELRQHDVVMCFGSTREDAIT